MKRVQVRMSKGTCTYDDSVRPNIVQPGVCFLLHRIWCVQSKLVLHWYGRIDPMLRFEAHTFFSSVICTNMHQPDLSHCEKCCRCTLSKLQSDFCKTSLKNKRRYLSKEYPPHHLCFFRHGRCSCSFGTQACRRSILVSNGYVGSLDLWARDWKLSNPSQFECGCVWH